MAFTDAIDTQLARFRASYAKTPLPRFFSWWWRELVGMLPKRWRALLAERPDELLIEASGTQELSIWRQSQERCADFGRIALSASADEQRAEFARLRAQIDDPGLRVYYCIAPQRCLRRELSLPAAAEERLRQVLAFEMDRQTPFKADQVYYDCRVIDRDAATKTLRVALDVVPRVQLDRDLAALVTSGIALDGVDCWKGVSGAGRAGLNLLPPERRIKHRNPRLRLNLGLAGAALVLLITAMYLSVSNRQAALADMTAEVEKEQAAAKQVSARRKALQDTIASANFLNHKKMSAPLMTEVLNDLTKRLPDDTYLERLTMDERGKIEITGISANASRLVEDLQKSDVLDNPGIQGTIQPDPRTKKERFTLAAQLVRKVPPSSAPSTDAGAAKPKATAKPAGSAPATGSGVATAPAVAAADAPPAAPVAKTASGSDKAMHTPAPNANAARKSAQKTQEKKSGGTDASATRNP